jgi:site-specific DNA-methyltransferase (adenine-specific)
VLPYYERDGIAIYHGDCREVMDALPAQSFDLILTDPPFSVPVKYQDAEGVYPRSWGDLAVMEPFFAQVFKHLQRLVRRSGHVYVHCDGETYPLFFKIAYPLWPQSHLIVWFKPSGRRGRGWLHSHELVLHLRTPETLYREGFRQDVIGVMPVRTLDRKHPAEKPGGLLSFLAEAHPKPSLAVLDPFMGSGATLVTARALGHRAIGIDSEERWCEVAAQSLAQDMLALGV